MYALIGLSIAVLAIVVGVTCFVIKQSKLEKKPNPEIKKMMKAFDVVSVGGCRADINQLIFYKANGFIKYAELEGQNRVFMCDKTNHVSFFYYKKNWLINIKLPKRV